MLTAFRRWAHKRQLYQKVLVRIPYYWSLLFVLMPLLIIISLSVTEESYTIPPFRGFIRWTSDQALIVQLNFGKYLNLLHDTLYHMALWRSIKVSLLSTFFALIIGYPMAYSVVRANPEIRVFLLMFVILPFWTPFLIRVYAWIGLLSDEGVINSFLMKIHLISTPLPLSNNLFSVCTGIVYAYLPFMILPLYVALDKIDFGLLEAAYDLGCRPVKAFWKITVPLSKTGIYGGSLGVFIPVLGEYVVPELLGGIDEFMISKVLWTRFFGSADWPQATSLAVTLIALIIIPVIMVEKLTLQRLVKRPKTEGRV